MDLRDRGEEPGGERSPCNESAAAASKPLDVASRSRPRIRTALVVEDDDVIRHAVAELLEDDGFAVIAAADLDHARHALFQTADRVGVLVLDLALPDGDGETLLAQLSGCEDAPPAVVLSALGARADQAATAYGIPGLSKPIDLSLLATSVAVAYENDIRPRDPAGNAGGRPTRRFRVA